MKINIQCKGDNASVSMTLCKAIASSFCLSKHVIKHIANKKSCRMNLYFACQKHTTKTCLGFNVFASKTCHEFSFCMLKSIEIKTLESDLDFNVFVVCKPIHMFMCGMGSQHQ